MILRKHITQLFESVGSVDIKKLRYGTFVGTGEHMGFVCFFVYVLFITAEFIVGASDVLTKFAIVLGVV